MHIHSASNRDFGNYFYEAVLQNPNYFTLFSGVDQEDFYSKERRKVAES